MSAPSMQVIEISQSGGPEVLRLTERHVPSPAAGEVLIRVQAAGVNRPDVLQRKGAYAPPAGASDLPGLEVSGTIENGNVGSSGFKIGDEVCALVAGGGYAEFCVAPVAQCLPKPHALSFAEAAGLPETYFTVWSNVFDRGRLVPGESLLVQGGSSGIGVAAIQLATASAASCLQRRAATKNVRLVSNSGRSARSTTGPKTLQRSSRQRQTAVVSM